MHLFGRDGVVTRKRTTALVSLTAAALVFGFVGSLYAALPPQYQVWREFGMVTGDPKIPDMLGGTVDRIERVTDGYRVWAGKCYVPVAILPIEKDANAQIPIGPAQVRAQSGPVQCPITMLIQIPGRGGEK